MGPEKEFLDLADALLKEFDVTHKNNYTTVSRYDLAYAAQAFVEATLVGETDG